MTGLREGRKGRIAAEKARAEQKRLEEAQAQQKLEEELVAEKKTQEEEVARIHAGETEYARKAEEEKKFVVEEAAAKQKAAHQRKRLRKMLKRLGMLKRRPYKMNQLVRKITTSSKYQRLPQMLLLKIVLSQGLREQKVPLHKKHNQHL